MLSRDKCAYCQPSTKGVHCSSSPRAAACIVGPPNPGHKEGIAMAQSQTALRVVESSSMDKSKALDAALSQIERNFGKGSIMRLGKSDKNLDVDTVSTGSLGLDIALGIGGGPRGRGVRGFRPGS